MSVFLRSHSLSGRVPRLGRFFLNQNGRSVQKQEVRSLGDSSVDPSAGENIFTSPFPDIDYTELSTPLPEFLTRNWNNGAGLKDKTAIVDASTGETRTFGDFERHIGAIAGFLRNECGVVPGSTVSLISPNHVDYLPIMVAVGRCGAQISLFNPLYTVDEMAPLFEHSNTSVLISHADMLGGALQAAHRVDCVEHVIVIPDAERDTSATGTISFEDLKSYSDILARSVPEVFKDTLNLNFVMPFSSGTTGLPKGVCLSHANIVANILQLDHIEKIGVPSDYTVISPLPFFHIYGMVVSSLYSAYIGNTLVTMSKKFDLEVFCSTVEKYRPDRAHLVPPIMLGLAKHPAVLKYDLKSIKTIISAAAPLSSDMEKEVTKRFEVNIKQGWGMSELSPLGTLSCDATAKSGSVGPLVGSTVAKIIDTETQKSLGPGKTGELFIKGPQLMSGYWNAPEKTAETITRDGWLKTGDVGYFDDDHYFHVTDRMKELIKFNGHPVAPAEIEALLLTHPSIQDAAVIAIEDEKNGEHPRAYIVQKDGHVCSEEEIVEWAGNRLAPQKHLRGGVEFRDTIPKSASGKILRRILKEEYTK